MKKNVFLSVLVAIAMSMMAGGLASCSGCSEPSAPNYDYDGVAQDFTAGVEHIAAMHRQTVYRLYGGEQYAWYETRVVFNDSIKAETIAGLKVTDVTDIFQLFGPARCQWISTDVKEGTIIPKPIPDIWIEDCDMSHAEIRLWPEDVLDKLKAWDGIIPPAKGMTLRIPLGPRRCNAQWVIGNIMQVIFVDAVTGDITDWCPAFPVPGVSGPLGEWP